MYGVNGSHVTAGQQDYAERLSQIESQKEDYYKKLGIAPGIPTMKGSYADPENTGIGYNTIIKELGDHTVPAEWAQYVKKNTEADTAPGAPIAWDDPSDPDEAQPGYGFVADGSADSEETYFFHSDHLGSTSYITDKDGNITQYDAYLPYGELLVDEHSSSEEMPYKFNGKEFDEETGLYYYGARYMNPVASVWYGVDPLAEQYVTTGAYVYCLGNPINLIDKLGKQSEKPNKPRPRKIAKFYIYENKWPNVYKNHVIGMKGKKMVRLTYDSNPKNKIKRRKEATKDVPTMQGFDRDEFPYACTMEGGKGASVMLVPSSENQSHGGTLGRLIVREKLETGDFILVILEPAEKQKQPSPDVVTVPSIKVQDPKPEHINPIVGGVTLGTLGTLGVKLLGKSSPIMNLFNILCTPLMFDNTINEQMNNNNIR